jgi:hypothetical protein
MLWWMQYDTTRIDAPCCINKGPSIIYNIIHPIALMVIIQMIYAIHRTPKQSPRPLDTMTAWPPIIQKDVGYESNVDEKTVPDYPYSL